MVEAGGRSVMAGSRRIEKREKVKARLARKKEEELVERQKRSHRDADTLGSHARHQSPSAWPTSSGQAATKVYGKGIHGLRQQP